jgi:disease resistance protein RPS2
MPTGAEAVAVGATASHCLKCCCNQFDQYIVEAGKNVSELESEVSKLSAMARDIKNTVTTRRLGKSIEVVDNWLDRSAAIEKEAKKMSDNYAAMCLDRLNCWTRYRIGKRAIRKLQKTKDLIDERKSLEEALASTTPMKHELQEKQIETLVVGMDPYLEKALLYIDKDEVGVIGICGMGGVGKSTLLLKIHGEFLPGKERSKDFNKVVWAVVSKKSNNAGDTMQNDIARLQNNIAKQLGLHLDNSNMLDNNCSNEVLEQRALPIYQYLSTRNFLLLLDDLWSPLDLKSIGVPDPTSSCANSQRKRKVVLTSRSKTICGQMQAAPGLIDVKCLDDGDAWRLFEFCASKQTIASHTAISGLAQDVMKECQGLPLALNTIGKALSTKSGDPNPWKEALNKLKNARHSEIPGMQKENAAMLHRIKISYDYLPSQSAKNCFLSCCLWPEDCSIEKAKLVESWLGLGLIPSSSAIDDDDIDRGLGIITSLKEARLLESGDDEATEVRMHDILRAMSLWISSDCGGTRNKWIVKAGIGIKTKQRVAEQWQECSPGDTERVSLMNNYIEELPSVVPKIDRLQVLMLQRNPSLRVVPGPFLLSAPVLTYLDLSNTIIEELPQEVGLLHHLQYLNLSESYIRKLPKELSCLTQLRHLLMNATRQLGIIPYGIISKLVQLQMLDIFKSMYAMKTNSAAAGASEDNDMYSCLGEFEARKDFLKWLGITLDSIDALQRLARCNTVSTRRLCFRTMPSPPSLHLLPSRLSELLGGLDMLESLEEFMAMSCVSLEQVIIEGGSDRDKYRGGYCLPKLEKLELLSLPKLEHIRFQGMPGNEFFPRLRSVKIAACSKLKNVNWVLYLPQLLHLELQFCPSMEKLIDGGIGTENSTNEVEQENHTFPLLKRLIIHSLKNLTSLCSGSRSVQFPELEVVEITQCTNLTEVNIRPQGKLREIRGGEEWWRGLRWEEPSVRDQLQPYFQYQGHGR